MEIMAKKKHLRVLFIGNSHTYYHDLPAWVALMAKEEGYECDVTMLAHPGWYLHQHVKEPEVRFNIKYGSKTITESRLPFWITRKSDRA